MDNIENIKQIQKEISNIEGFITMLSLNKKTLLFNNELDDDDEFFTVFNNDIKKLHFELFILRNKLIHHLIN
jgi:hypothetical protein